LIRSFSRISTCGYRGTSRIRNPGYRGTSLIRNPGYRGTSLIRNPSYRGTSLIRNPGYRGTSLIRNPGYEGTSLIRNPGYRGTSLIRNPAHRVTSLMSTCGWWFGLSVRLQATRKRLQMWLVLLPASQGLDCFICAMLTQQRWGTAFPLSRIRPEPSTHEHYRGTSEGEEQFLMSEVPL